LKEGEDKKGNKDFILQYRLRGNQIESGLLLHRGKEENFFLAMIQPPKNVTEKDIPPREYVFIVDVSGSMNGFPLDVSKTLLRNLISNLRSSDRFNVLFFAGGSNLFSEKSVPATEENINRALTMLNNQRGGGGTELIRALNRALALPGTEDFSRSFIIATDGYVSVEKETFDLIRNNLGSANFFSFGIGSSVNRYIIEGMAHVGMGLPFIITKASEANKEAEKFRKYIQTPVLTNIEVTYDGFDVYDVEPISVPDVLAERPVILYGKWKGSPKGRIVLTGKTGNESYRKVIDVSDTRPESKNSGLMYLWARERIRLLDDYNHVSRGDTKHAEKITELGLKYNLLTNYTSFIAIDSEIRNEGGQVTTVKQPLPLPEGVSNYAVGGVSSASAVKGLRTSQKIKPGYPAHGVPEREYILAEDDESTVFAIVEKSPQFKGGIEALKKFIRSKVVYPESLRGKGITGRVFVEFTVDKDGSVIDVKVIRGVYPLLDKEAIRVIKLTSKMWKPAESGGKAVKAQMVLPVEFN
jgi:Ca-activated chloride channel family protein